MLHRKISAIGSNLFAAPRFTLAVNFAFPKFLQVYIRTVDAEFDNWGGRFGQSHRSIVAP